MSLAFGLVTIAAGLLGVPLGSYLSQKLRPRFRTADPLICAYGMLVSSPILYIGMVIAISPHSLAWVYLTMFLGTLLLNLNWSLVADMSLVNFTFENSSGSWRFLSFSGLISVEMSTDDNWISFVSTGCIVLLFLLLNVST